MRSKEIRELKVVMILLDEHDIISHLRVQGFWVFGHQQTITESGEGIETTNNLLSTTS
jgi:hypothetical protein